MNEVESRVDRFARLVIEAGANVQPGQIVAVTAYVGGHEELARAVARAAYRRGARFVDVEWFDPLVKRERIAHASDATLGFVPSWYGARTAQLGEQRCARVALVGMPVPDALAGLDPTRAGKDTLPFHREVRDLVNARTTNWSAVPGATRGWASRIFSDLPVEIAYERLWEQLEHVLCLHEPDPANVWHRRMARLDALGAKLTKRCFDAIRFEGPGTDLTVGLLPTSRFVTAAFETVDGIRHVANLPSEEVFTTPDPTRTEGYVTATKPLALRDGTVIRGLRLTFEAGALTAVDARENVGAFRSIVAVDAGASRIGEVALVDEGGRVGSLGTVFYDTLLDENAASHIAFGDGFAFAAGADDAPRINKSATHLDVMVGSADVRVTGVDSNGTETVLLEGKAWRF